MNLYEKRDFGQKINATFEFIRENFKPLLLSLSYIVLPFTLITAVVQVFLLQELLQGKTITGLAVFTPTYFVSLVLSIINTMMVYLTVNGYLLEYEEGARDITPAQVWQRVGREILPALWLTLLATLFTVFGFFLFLLPGIYLMGILPFMYMVFTREQRGALDTVLRCQQLTQSPWWSPVVGSFLLVWLLFFEEVRKRVRNWWSTVALMVVVLFIQVLLALVFQIPTGIMTVLSGMGLGSATSPVLLSIFSVLSNVGGTILSALFPIAAAFQYYNFLAQVEGTDLLSAIETLGDSKAKPRTEDEGDY